MATHTETPAHKEEKAKETTHAQTKQNVEHKHHQTKVVDVEKKPQEINKPTVNNAPKNENTKKQIIDSITSRLQAEKENSAKQQVASKQESSLGAHTPKHNSAHHQHFDISTNTVRKHKERTLDM